MKALHAILVGLLLGTIGAAAPPKAATPAELAEWYELLVGAGVGFPAVDHANVPDRVLRGVFGFLDHPAEAVPFLREKLKPTDGPDATAIDGWVKDLFGEDAKARTAADEKLRKHRDDYLVVNKLLAAGRATESQPLRRRVLAVIGNTPVEEPKEGEAEPPIQFTDPAMRTLLRSRPSTARQLPLEARQMPPFREQHHRAYRVALVLERIGTADALDALKEMAGGRAGLPGTTAATETLERVKAKAN